MTDASGTTSYTYTARNQLLSKAAPQGTLSYTYNLAGAVQTLRSSNTNGVSVDYGYDELNRLKTVLDNRLTAGANTTSYGYDPDSDLQSTTLPNGVLTTATYNTLDRLTRLTSTKSATTLADYNYTLLGAAGERKQVVELGGRQVDYGYDNAYRLTSETISVVSPGSLVATYDHTDDRQSGITYDNNGNTTVASGVTYGYDFLNRLTSATSSGGITFTYDGDGTRVQATASGVTTSYLVDDQNPTGSPQVVEELVGGAVQRQYTYGHALISQTQVPGTPTTSFYGDDGLGSVRYLTDTSGATTDRYDYDAFGNLLTGSTPTPNSYRFAGEQLDTNLGLYYLRARYYNAGSGRFWTRDRAGFVLRNPAEVNRYTYVADNPANAVDPTGLAAFFEYEGQLQDSVGKTRPLYSVYRTAGSRVLGPQEALASRNWLIRLTEEGFTGPYRQNLSLAVSHIKEGGVLKEFIAINGRVTDRALISFLQQEAAASGAEFVPATYGSQHAELVLFDKAAQIAAAENVSIDQVIYSIGIGNVGGPCPACMAEFGNIALEAVKIGLYWLRPI